MKRLGYSIVALILFALPVITLAAEFRTGEQPAVRLDERVANDLYMAGGSVTSAGTITGDLIAGAGNIVISGPVSQDVIVGGGNVSIIADVGDDVRVGGGNIVIQGKVGGDVIAGGGQVTLGGPGVAGDVVIGAGSVRIDAPVGGTLKIGGGNVFINAPITGNITIEADTVTLGSAAVISGNLSYKATKELIKEDGAVVTGKVDFKMQSARQAPASLAVLVSMWTLGKFLVLLASALCLGLILRRYSNAVVAKAVERPLLEIGRGLVVIITLPILSVLLLVTVVGIPFGILGLLGFVSVLILACILSPIIVGSVLYRYFSKQEVEVSWKSILLGAFVCSIIGLVPFIGGLIQMLLGLLSIGVLAAVKWESIQQWR